MEGKKDKGEFLTIQQFCKKYTWPSEAGLRTYIHRSKELGLCDAFFRFKRRVFIYPDKFFTLLQENKNSV